MHCRGYIHVSNGIAQDEDDTRPMYDIKEKPITSRYNKVGDRILGTSSMNRLHSFPAGNAYRSRSGC